MSLHPVADAAAYAFPGAILITLVFAPLIAIWWWGRMK